MPGPDTTPPPGDFRPDKRTRNLLIAIFVLALTTVAATFFALGVAYK